MERPGGRRGRYRALVERVGDPIYMLDGDGQVTVANRAMAMELGYDDPGAVEGEHVSAFIPDDDFEQWTELLLELVADDGDWATFEMAVLPVDGGPIEVENKVAPLVEDGELVGSVGVLRDVGDRKARERRLRELTATIERLQSFTVDLQSAESATDVYELGVEAAVDILGMDWCTVVVAEDGWLELKAVSEEAPFDVGDRHLRVDEGVAGLVYQTGESHIIHDTADSETSEPVDEDIRSGLTVPLGEQGIFQATADRPNAFDQDDLDLVELLAGHVSEALRRIEREQELRRQNERLERFASVVSHDLRNPLNVAQGYADVVDDPAAEEITEALDRIETIVEDVLVLARQGRTVDDLAPVSLAGAARGAWCNVETEGADLTVEDDATVLADRERLVAVLENLFNNAVDHGSTSARKSEDAVEHGSTDHRSQAREDAVEEDSAADDEVDAEWPTIRVGVDLDPPTLYIADDGPGIPPGERDQAFEMGFTTSDDGTGFGLAIVEEIAAAHDWDADVVESEAGGARFEFTGVSPAPES